MIRSQKMQRIMEKRLIKKKSINYQYEIGCWLTTYNRPELLIDSTSSLLKCKDLTGIKFFIVDDASTDPKIDNILQDLNKKLTARGNLVEIVKHSNNYGKKKFHKTLKECFNGLQDCRYLFPISPDVIMNPHIFQVARHCKQFISDDTKVIAFYIDDQFENVHDQGQTFHNDFKRTKLIDWFPALFENKFVREFMPGMKNSNSEQGTATTHTIYETAQVKSYNLLQYKESLCQHIGNENSAMNIEYRKIRPIKMARLNLDNIPEILQQDVIQQASEIPGPDSIKPIQSDNKSILVVKSCGFGNIICITPVIKKLKELYPDKAIDLLVENDKYRQLLIGWDKLRNIYIDGDQPTMPQYNIIINGMPCKIDISGLTGNVYTGEAVWYQIYMHEVQANMKILHQCGWDQNDFPLIPEMYIPEPNNKRRLDKEYPGKKYIGISAGFDDTQNLRASVHDSMDFKNWGYEKFAELLMKLLEKYKDYKVLIFGIGKDKKIIDYCIMNHRVINCVDQYSIQESAYLIGKCKFMVANDTGLSHISSAVNTKCYTLFGMTPARKALPWKSGVEVSLNLLCAPTCYYDKRWNDCEHKKCLKDMSVDFVYDRIIEKEKYELGIMIATYDRYELLICTLSSLLSTFNDPSVKISFINDGSTDTRVGHALFEFKKVFKGQVSIIGNHVNKGRLGYPFTLRMAWTELFDCKYILTMPDDAIISKYSYQVFKKSYKYFKDGIKCINYFRDGRAKVPYVDSDKEFFKSDPYDKYFDLSSGFDGFMCLFENKFLKTLDWNAPATEGKTNFWKYFHLQLKDYKNLLYKESLIMHTGNLSSVMWQNVNGKRHLNIEGTELNLWDEPLILTDKVFKYSAEWYSEQYHGKGAYGLPKRKYNELQDEWENLGYKKRFYKVLDDAERYIDFKEIKSICEAGCHHGKSVFWMRERYSDIKYDAFDFSKVAVEWCQQNNPYNNINFKMGDVQAMPYKDKFDLVTCLDVGEHLPEDVYFKMIKELKRISGKYILWYVGRTVLEEHINLRSIEQQKKDLKELGSIIELPQYHLLIRRK